MSIDRSKSPPPPLSPVPFNVPEAFRTSLPNGLRVVIVDDPRVPLVSFRLAFLRGDAHDPRNHIGVTSAMASMLTEGTEKYSSRELAEKVERLGASLSASANEDFTFVAASTLSIYADEILELIGEVTVKPTFPDSELDLYKRNTLENLKYQRSQPNFLANEQASRLVYGEHPYSIVSPKPADIEKLDRESLLNIHRDVIDARNAVLIAVGDVGTDDLLKRAEDIFGMMESAGATPPAFPEVPTRESRSLTIVDRPGSAQANIVIVNSAIPRNHPDHFAATVLNQVLGAGASSRVFMNLREEKGYTYGAYTRFDAKRFAGDFEATAEVRTAVTGDSLKEFFYELNRIRDEKVSDGELADAKSFLTGVFPIRAETQEGLTGLIVSQTIYDLADNYLQTYRERINAVTADEVLRVANEYIRPGEFALVIVGDAAEIIRQAKDHADSVDVFDTEGVMKDIGTYSETNAARADAAGKWALSLDLMGRPVPITLTIDQDGNEFSGKMVTMLGEGTIERGRVRGNEINATAVAEMSGQPVEFVISGSIEGDTISGSITAPIVNEPISFTGEREPQAGAAN